MSPQAHEDSCPSKTGSQTTGGFCFGADRIMVGNALAHREWPPARGCKLLTVIERS